MERHAIGKLPLENDERGWRATRASRGDYRNLKKGWQMNQVKQRKKKSITCLRGRH